MRCRHFPNSKHECLQQPCHPCVLVKPDDAGGEPCPWDDCIYPDCSPAMGCVHIRKPAHIKTVINT